jgi:hypothetical protein
LGMGTRPGSHHDGQDACSPDEGREDTRSLDGCGRGVGDTLVRLGSFGLMRLFPNFFPTFRLSFFPTLASEEDCHVPFYWLVYVRTWSCGHFLLKSRASGPCAVPWQMSASFSEGSQISAVTRAVSG